MHEFNQQWTVRNRRGHVRDASRQFRAQRHIPAVGKPDGPVATKPYTLLRKALERNSKAAGAKFAWHGRERLGLLRIKDNVIVLHAMRWPDEIHSPETLAPPAVDIPDGEIDEASP
ncbi:Ku protein [Streptomyces sp. NPDC046821]|uniref:Ku protein n=1 Tax=Streptomyces sp. NPDC046821 TaxID=3154702 RepID=UPI0034060C23